jgi:hypothetical protein
MSAAKKHAPRVMTPRDLQRLRGEAAPSTHLARYELANDLGARVVLDEPCPCCGAHVRVACSEGVN